MAPVARWVRRLTSIGVGLAAAGPATVLLLQRSPQLARRIRENPAMFKLYLERCWWPYCFWRRWFLLNHIRQQQRQCLYVCVKSGMEPERRKIASLAPAPLGTARLVFVSDTHRTEAWLSLPPGDVLVHCGDALLEDRDEDQRSVDAFTDFARWFQSQPHKHKILIAGNHDAVLERLGASGVQQILDTVAPDVADNHGQATRPDCGATLYMCGNTTTLRIDNQELKLAASPYSHANSAASTNRAYQGAIEELVDWLDKLGPPPSESEAPLDLLLTHGPSDALTDWVGTHQPRVHAYGHVHSAYGARWQNYAHGRSTFVANAALADNAYAPMNPSIVVDLPLRTSRIHVS
eukprot:COSAG02_NODE_3848_length_6150_cov_2.038176_1_plen_349_part_00